MSNIVTSTAVRRLLAHALPRALSRTLAATALLAAPVSAQNAPPVCTDCGPATLRAFTGVTLYDGTGGEPIPNANVLVQNGRVVMAGPSAKVPVPLGAQVVPLTGKFLMPGLINAHGHASSVANLAT